MIHGPFHLLPKITKRHDVERVADNSRHSRTRAESPAALLVAKESGFNP